MDTNEKDTVVFLRKVLETYLDALIADCKKKLENPVFAGIFMGTSTLTTLTICLNVYSNLKEDLNKLPGLTMTQLTQDIFNTYLSKRLDWVIDASKTVACCPKCQHTLPEEQALNFCCFCGQPMNPVSKENV